MSRLQLVNKDVFIERLLYVICYYFKKKRKKKNVFVGRVEREIELIYLLERKCCDALQIYERFLHKKLRQTQVFIAGPNNNDTVDR